MTVTAGADTGTRWYAIEPEAAENQLGGDPKSGLSAARAAELLKQNGPNALPAEKPVPGWLRFVSQYRDYMQIILVVAGIVSIAIAEYSTGILLFALSEMNSGSRINSCAKWMT